MTEKVNLFNFGYITKKLPTTLYNNLLNECNESINNNEIMVSGLSSKGVAKHFFVNKNLENLKNFIRESKNDYDKTFPNLGNIRVMTDNVELQFATPWINIQKKYEFIPNHVHDGIYSYTIWMKIPFNNNERYEGNFEFTYNDITGRAHNHLIKLTKEDEGSMIMFPSKLIHTVYPFYDTDEYRISISGNIVLNTKK